MVLMFAITMATLLAGSEVLLADRDQYGESTKEDMIVVIFAFDVHRDGTIHNIRVTRCENTDRNEVKAALTPEEKAWGTRIVASKHLKPDKDDLGKTRYTYLIFDKRLRKYPK